MGSILVGCGQSCIRRQRQNIGTANLTYSNLQNSSANEPLLGRSPNRLKMACPNTRVSASTPMEDPMKTRRILFVAAMLAASILPAPSTTAGDLPSKDHPSPESFSDLQPFELPKQPAKP